MADSTPPAQPAAAPAESAVNLHKDEVTGEMVSKSELKKRTKQREQEKKKQEKAAKNPVPSRPKKEAEVELNPNVRLPPCRSSRMQADIYTQQYFEIRSTRINALRKSKDPNPLGDPNYHAQKGQADIFQGTPINSTHTRDCPISSKNTRI